MKCQKCGSDHAKKYKIRLEVIAPKKKGFEAEVTECDNCMQGWYDLITAITKQLPDGTWKKWGG